MSIDVEIKNQLFRRISPDWRLFLTWKVFHFYDKQRTVLPRLGVAWPVWDLIENHDAIQCDVTKCFSANTQVNRHPCVVSEKATSRSPPKKHACSSGHEQRGEKKKGRKKKHVKTKKIKKCADISALCWFKRWASSHCICIHINIHTVLPESRPVVVFKGGRKKKASEVVLSPTTRRCYHFAAISGLRMKFPFTTHI